MKKNKLNRKIKEIKKEKSRMSKLIKGRVEIIGKNPAVTNDQFYDIDLVMFSLYTKKENDISCIEKRFEQIANTITFENCENAKNWVDKIISATKKEIPELEKVEYIRGLIYFFDTHINNSMITLAVKTNKKGLNEATHIYGLFSAVQKMYPEVDPEDILLEHPKNRVLTDEQKNRLSQFVHILDKRSLVAPLSIYTKPAESEWID